MSGYRGRLQQTDGLGVLTEELHPSETDRRITCEAVMLLQQLLWLRWQQRLRLQLRLLEQVRLRREPVFSRLPVQMLPICL